MYIFYKIQPFDNKKTTKYCLYSHFYATSFLFNPHTSFGFIFRLFSSVLKFFFGKSNYLSWYGIAQVVVVVVVAGITPRTDLPAAVEEMQRCKSKLISNTHPAAASASLLQSHHARRRTRTSMRRVPCWACQRARSCHTFPHHHRTWTWESSQVQSPSRTSTKWQRCVDSRTDLDILYVYLNTIYIVQFLNLPHRNRRSAHQAHWRTSPRRRRFLCASTRAGSI